MAFTSALYYPTIDITDEAWLKSAMLYWDQIWTIVPASIRQPYNTYTSRAFYDAKALLPYYVRPDEGVTEILKQDIKNYFKTRQGKALLKPSTSYAREESRSLDRGVLSDDFFELHPEKVFSEVHNTMQPLFHDGWYRVDENLKNFYMTLLATRISKGMEAGLLTDLTACNRLANAATLDARLFPSSGRGYFTHGDGSAVSRFAQGALVNVVLEGIRIDPDTPVDKLLKFRADHQGPLGSFRSKVAALSKSVSVDDSDSFDAFLQRVRDEYLTEVIHEISLLKEELKYSGIKWRIGDLLSIVSLATVPVLLNSLRVTPLLSILSGVGVSVVSYAIRYRVEKAKMLRENPFSYLLRAERSFTIHRRMHEGNGGLQIPRPL